MWRMYKTNVEWYDKTNQLLKELCILVWPLNKTDNEPGDWIFGVCKYFVRKLTDYLFPTIGKETEFKKIWHKTKC